MEKEKQAAAGAGWPLENSVVIRGEREAVVYGCRRILAYRPDCICLLCHGRCVCVEGEALLCTAFSAGSVTVEGRIIGVRYGKEEGER